MRGVGHRRHDVEILVGVLERLPDAKIIGIHRRETEEVRGNNLVREPFAQVREEVFYRRPLERRGRLEDRELHRGEVAVRGEANVVEIQLVEAPRAGVFGDGDVVIPRFLRGGVYPGELFVVVPRAAGTLVMDGELRPRLGENRILKDGDARDRVDAFVVQALQECVQTRDAHLLRAILHDIGVVDVVENVPGKVLNVDDDGVQFRFLDELDERGDAGLRARGPARGVERLDDLRRILQLALWFDVLELGRNRRGAGRRRGRLGRALPGHDRRAAR